MLKFYSEMSNFYKKSWDFFPAYDLTLIPAGFEPATVRLEGECSYLSILSKKASLVNHLFMIGRALLNRKRSINLFY